MLHLQPVRCDMSGELLGYRLVNSSYISPIYSNSTIWDIINLAQILELPGYPEPRDLSTGSRKKDNQQPLLKILKTQLGWGIPKIHINQLISRNITKDLTNENEGATIDSPAEL